LVGEARFDWIVASHVIEHVPDVIGFVNQCAEILTEGGVLSLAVPDRRHTFDYYRPASGLREMIDAHLEGRSLSSPGAAAEHFLYLWQAKEQEPPSFLVPMETVRDRFERARSGAYVDVHAWVFTPHSFRLAMEDLSLLELIRLREARFLARDEFEFYVQLTRAGAGPGLERAALAHLALQEAGA
jgi:SAM-dependent methyltransferase